MGAMCVVEPGLLPIAVGCLVRGVQARERAKGGESSRMINFQAFFFSRVARRSVALVFYATAAREIPEVVEEVEGVFG